MADKREPSTTQPENIPSAVPQIDKHPRRPFYEPLPTSTPHFRLLTLLGYDDSGRPKCSLSVFRLCERTYTALSYAWGPAPATKLILVNGRWRCIRSNLYEFLTSNAAKRRYIVPLFVDAVCINQRDTVEKETQIALMGQIYRQASQVLLWSPPRPRCNPLDRDSSRQMQQLRETIAMMQRNPLASGFGMLSQTEKVFRVSRLGLAINSNPACSRLWVTQEMILAKSVIILLGDLALDLEMFELAYARACPFLYDVLSTAINHGTTVGALHYQFWRLNHALGLGDPSHPLVISCLRRKVRMSGSFQRQPLYKLIATCGTRESTMRHDMVFGMLGMAESHIRPDYRISLTDLYLYVLIEGIRTIHAEAFDAPEQQTFCDTQALLGGSMNAFDLSPTDLTVCTVTMLASWPIVPYSPRRPPSHGLLLPAQIAMRPLPLLQHWRWLRNVSTIAEGVWTPVCNCMMKGPATLLLLPAMRNVLLLLAMSVLARWDVEFSMPDGTAYTISEWEQRIQEIDALVEQGIPPRTRIETPHNGARRRTDGKRVGEALGLVFVLSLSLLLAWLGVHLGCYLDAWCAAGCRCIVAGLLW